MTPQRPVSAAAAHSSPPADSEAVPGTWLSFTPRDTVFVRDGRSFDAATDVSARSVLPWPSTIAGACRTALARDEDPHWVRGPLPARRSGEVWNTHFPVPADLVAEPEGGDGAAVHRLAVGARQQVTDLGDQVRGWLEPPAGMAEVKPITGWVDSGAMTAYLAGELHGEDGLEVAGLGVTDPFKREPRIGLAREDRRLRTGYLYQAVHLRPEDGWGFVASCGLPDGWTIGRPGPVPLGGQGRLADVAVADGAGWPCPPQAFPDGKVLVYVATPALWEDGWRPPLPPDAELVAAAVGDPVPVATTSPRLGWDRHRRLRWAVPAGSVYLMRFAGQSEQIRADRARAWAMTVHGRALGPAVQEIVRTAGFGVVLTGVWT